MADSGNAGGPAHLLSLKVMRLSRPSFVQTSPLPFEHDPSLPAHAALLKAAENELTAPSEPANPAVADLLNLHSPTSSSSATPTPLNLREFGLSDLLTLPSSFGNIYLGETFSSYLCVNNESLAAAQEVGIKAELQTGSQRFTLADTLTSTPRGSSNSHMSDNPAGAPTRVPLLPTQSAEFVIHHEIKELGVHILVCSVHYSTNAGERRFFRKFYKFQVLNPLSVKTKVNSLTDGQIFLEAQVQNVASEPMFLERMRFEAGDLFQFSDLNTVIPRDGTTTPATRVVVGSTQDGSTYLNQQDTRQYLYMLQPKKPHDPVARTTPTLGKLDIMWRTHLGQTGRLQTSQLSRKVPPIDPYDISVISSAPSSSPSSSDQQQPNRISAEQPFTLTCRVHNNLVSETLRLTLHGVKSKMSSVLLMGPSDHAFGNIGPLQHVDITLQFFPLLAGLHKISGFRLAEMVSGTSRDIDNLAEVYVWQ
ncbi:hypothetical protein PhCBS80983_g03082 [Powellomyces hirtus]|uniref:Trafficking protein particle complex subunit 13 n=1 Tax=Powellomyces hirtus TaxID=109895 RepID=A0A507E3W2_9FUNG|nr:hypothetical protein PhCBS80983_g03082 [Powellomyces hirtus]